MFVFKSFNYVLHFFMLQCMFQSWFLTSEMHFFIFGPILAYLLHKKPKLGFIITLILFLISIIIPFLVIYTKNLDGVLKVYMR